MHIFLSRGTEILIRKMADIPVETRENEMFQPIMDLFSERQIMEDNDYCQLAEKDDDYYDRLAEDNGYGDPYWRG